MQRIMIGHIGAILAHLGTKKYVGQNDKTKFYIVRQHESNNEEIVKVLTECKETRSVSLSSHSMTKEKALELIKALL